MDASEYINLRALSKRLSVAPRTLRNWMRDPTEPLPVYKVKGTLLFNWAEVERWIEGYKVKAVDVDAVADELLTTIEKGD